MNDFELDVGVLQNAAADVRRAWGDASVRAGLVLGSGWGDVVAAFPEVRALDYAAIPGFGVTGAPGHAGRLVLAELDGQRMLIFQGRRHWYEGAGWTPVTLPAFLLKELGAKVMVLTNASGGITVAPGQLMALEDHINLMSENPLRGPHKTILGDRFPDLSYVYDRGLLQIMMEAARHCEVKVGRGVYLAVSGPTFETPAEIRAYRTLGADVVGMSTVPEAILGHALGLRVAALSCVANYASGLMPEKLSGEDVLKTARLVMPHMRAVLAEFFRRALAAGPA